VVSPIFELELRKPFLKQIDREFTGLLKLMQFAQIKLPSSGILHNVPPLCEVLRPEGLAGWLLKQAA
jgi:hypothetical protein